MFCNFLIFFAQTTIRCFWFVTPTLLILSININRNLYWLTVTKNDWIQKTLSHSSFGMKTHRRSLLHCTSALQLCTHSDLTKAQYSLPSACFPKVLWRSSSWRLFLSCTLESMVAKKLPNVSGQSLLYLDAAKEKNNTEKTAITKGNMQLFPWDTGSGVSSALLWFQEGDGGPGFTYWVPPGRLDQ